MHQVFNVCWQVVSCWFLMLILYLPLMDIYGNTTCPCLFRFDSHFRSRCSVQLWQTGPWVTCSSFTRTKIQVLLLTFYKVIINVLCQGNNKRHWEGLLCSQLFSSFYLKVHWGSEDRTFELWKHLNKEQLLVCNSSHDLNNRINSP